MQELDIFVSGGVYRRCGMLPRRIFSLYKKIVTRVVIFGNDGEIYTGKFQHEGVNAKLVFYQVRLDLEDIMGDDEE